jgi:putative restriction endonuclease
MAAIVPLDQMQHIELQRLTEDNGFGLSQGEADGWARYTGLAIPHLLQVARSAEGGWLVSIAHAGVMETLTADYPAEATSCPDVGIAIGVKYLGPMIRRIAQLARSLPTAPHDTFVARTSALPKSTEAERLVVQRVGQDVFRSALLDYWNSSCPLSGIVHPRLLRASHMKPWADCDTDAERLDPFNGLLLAAHLDAAFDAGLISFRMDGSLIISPAFSDEDINRLGLPDLPPLQGLRPRHEPYLTHHRTIVYQAATKV